MDLLDVNQNLNHKITEALLLIDKMIETIGEGIGSEGNHALRQAMMKVTKDLLLKSIEKHLDK